MINKLSLKQQRDYKVAVATTTCEPSFMHPPEPVRAAHQSPCPQGGQSSSLAQLESASHPYNSVCL